MKSLKTNLLVLTLLLSLAFLPAWGQINVILDTDLDSDVDDVGALAMLHTLEANHRIKILGIIVTSDDTHAAACAAAINTFYERPEIPVGVEKGIPLRSFSRYTKALASEFPTGDKQPLDATVLYRQLLAAAADQSVVLVSIGHLTNIRNLLESPPDSISPLTGNALVRQKVRLWSCMGGQFPEGKEANFYRPDPESTRIAVANWPGDVVFAGWEIGNTIITGSDFLEHSLPDSHPVHRAYALYNSFFGRQSWDQAALLYALSDKPFWELSERGKVVVYEDGSNAWEADPAGNHRYLKEKTAPQEIAKILDALMVGMYRPGY